MIRNDRTNTAQDTNKTTYLSLCLCESLYEWESSPQDQDQINTCDNKRDSSKSKTKDNEKQQNKNQQKLAHNKLVYTLRNPSVDLDFLWPEASS